MSVGGEAEERSGGKSGKRRARRDEGAKAKAANRQPPVKIALAGH